MLKHNSIIVLFSRYAEVFKETWKTRHFDHRDLQEKYESEFLPDAIELQESGFAPYLKWVSYGLIAMLLVTILWACVGKVDIVAVASGRLISDGYTKTLTPLNISVVKAIYVKNGDFVKKGQLLIQLDDSESAASVKKLEQVIPLLEKKVNSYKSLYRQSYVSEHEFFDKEKELLDAQAQLEQAKFIVNAMSVDAPSDGVITGLTVHTIGGIVSPGQQLLSVVPVTGALALEAYLNNKDIGFVEVGQEVSVKLDAFPFTRYGLIQGRVVSISQDSIEKQGEKPIKMKESDIEEKGQTTNNYQVKIELEKNNLMVDGKGVVLLPGMIATGEIKTGTRRLIDYLLSPLVQNITEAARER